MKFIACDLHIFVSIMGMQFENCHLVLHFLVVMEIFLVFEGDFVVELEVFRMSGWVLGT